MQHRFFYTHDGESASGMANEPAGNKENNNQFPEDPGTKDHRIPDGGGPADGFINEAGHNSGKGFLNSVQENKTAATEHPKNMEGNANKK